jgi:hypothetical protein
MSKSTLDDKPKFKMGDRVVFTGDSEHAAFPKGTELSVKGVDVPEYLCFEKQRGTAWVNEQHLVSKKEYASKAA